MNAQKHFLIGLFVLISGLQMSCKSDSPEPVVDAPLITSLFIADVSDNGNATDIEVSFSRAADETKISAYRLIIAPENLQLSLELAEGLANDRFVALSPDGQNKQFLLPIGTLDAEGNAIVEAKPYRAYVLSVADGSEATQNTLSTRSASLELLNKDIILERIINTEMAAWDLTSLAIAAVVDGEIVLNQGFGTNSINSNTPSSGNSLYIASSISKLFVATAIMQQYERGTIDLDEDAGTYLGYPLRNSNFPNEVITVRSLLTHQAALANPGQEAPELNTIYIDSVFSMDSWIKEFLVPGESHYNAALWKDYSPNSQHVNSNLGVTILAHLVEKVTGKEFRDYAEDEIFRPLGMDNTAYRMSTTGYFDETLLTDVFGASGNVLTPYFEGAVYPAGWMRMSVADVAQFMLAILNKGELNGQRILEEATVATMLEVRFPNANLAFESGVAALWRAFRSDWLGHTAGGIVTGSLMLNPESRKGFVVMTNKRGILTVSPDDGSGKIYQALEDYLSNF